MPATIDSLPPVSSTRLRVLVVEDESLVALDLEERLANLGYEVSGVVDNGADALSHVHAIEVDIVLMDIHLRSGADGIQTAENLRQITDIPVVFLTAHADEATLQRAELTEPFGYVIKPFDERELHAAIQTAHYRHRAESRMRKMERWLSTTLRSIGDGVIATDREGRVTFINAVAEELSGWTGGDALGRHLSEVFAIVTRDGPDETLDLFRRAMTDGVTITLGEDRYLRRRDEQLVPVDDSIAPIRDDDGVITGCVVIFRDDTAQLEAEKERRKLEAKMLEAQRLESLGVLTGGIAHDFNNLLVAVLCNASLARTMAPKDSPILECLHDIEEAADRAALLCRQMLNYAGQGHAILDELELSAFARDTIQLLETAIHKNVSLRLDLSDNLPRMRADRSQLQQVIMNLVINGSEAMEGMKGKLTVRTCCFHATRAFLTACRTGSELSEGDYLMLEVSDTGYGMTPDVLKRIFDPFFTTKFTGRGLGLAAIMGIVRNHGGALAVESAPGAGATFQVLFPPLKTSIGRAESPAPDLSWRGSGRVLVVDDGHAIRLAAGNALRHLGFEVDTAEDGVQGVAKATAKGAGYRFIMLDLTMPNLDGKAALQAIWAKMPALPILIMSGYSDQQVAQIFRIGGPMDFIQKPFSLGDLASKIKPLLAR